MRNFKKLLVVICVLALLTAGCVFAAFAADEEGTVEELNALIGAAEGESDPVAKYNAIIAAAEYLKTTNKYGNGYNDAVTRLHTLCVSGSATILSAVDVAGVKADVAYDYMLKADKLLDLYKLTDEIEGYADVKVQYDSALVRVVSVLNSACDANIENTLTTAKNHANIAKVNKILTDCPPFGDASVLDGVKADFAVLEAAQEAAIAKNYATLDASNRITNYDLPIYLNETWENRSTGLTNSLGSPWALDLKGIANKMGVLQESNGNKYMVHRYLEKEKPAGTYTQVYLGGNLKLDASAGFVIEFDVTTFSTFPNQGVVIETGSVNGAYFPPPYFAINANGDICKNDKSTVAISGAIIPGQWTHVTIVFDPDPFVYYLYVEGQFICQYDAKYQGVTKYDHAQVAFRISGGAGTSGEICFDNIQIYGGNNFRIHDKLKNMTDDEKFLYYVEYLTNEEYAVAERSVAYSTAKDLIDLYWAVDEEGNGTYTEYALSNPTIMDAVDTYVAFDIDSFLYEVGIKNLDGYISLVDQLSAIKRESATASQRNQIIEDITAFVAKNGDVINRTADRDNNGKADYFEKEAIVTQITREAKYDANATDFIRYIDRFVKSTTLSAKQRNYNSAYELAENDGIDIALILDESNPDRANFTALISAYETYRNADMVIYELNKSNNSNKIVKCISKINIYTTEEEWLANREFIEGYLNLLKDIIMNPDSYGQMQYDPEFEGIEEAIAFFNDCYSFFYAILQDEHVAHIQSVLDRVAATDAYIEKMGMISSLEKYVQVNDIDHKDARIINLLNNLDTCKAELQLREADYAKLLVQNAVYFVNIVERMRTAQTYNEQREYFEEASLLYFYIDVTVEGAAKAVEIYDEYKINLDRIAESSVRFIEAVAIYKACETEDEKYAALVECYYNAQFVEMSYDGAEEAMAEYLEAYNAYMNYVNAVNAEVTDSGNAIGSLRSNCGITNVIAIIIKKLFGV